MSSLPILGLLILGAGAWLWMDSLKAREIGIRAARNACAAEELLFLDATVAIQSIWPVRNEEGHMTWRRVYRFEYSDTGDNRRQGSVTLVGHEVVMLYIRPRLVAQEHTLH